MFRHTIEETSTMFKHTFEFNEYGIENDINEADDHISCLEQIFFNEEYRKWLINYHHCPEYVEDELFKASLQKEAADWQNYVGTELCSRFSFLVSSSITIGPWDIDYTVIDTRSNWLTVYHKISEFLGSYSLLDTISGIDKIYHPTLDQLWMVGIHHETKLICVCDNIKYIIKKK